MNSIRKTQRTYSNKISPLLMKIDVVKQTEQCWKIKQLSQNRTNHMRISNNSRNKLDDRPFFNNKTKQGQFLSADLKLNTYCFIPAYKNDTFIMPDRAFAKGKSAKRLLIKMKDTFVYSFRQKQNDQINLILKKEEKQKTIISRKAEELNKILDQNDGKKKAKFNRQFQKTKTYFNPTSKMEMFSQFQPLLQPRDLETSHSRKVGLSKTFDFTKKWRPATRGPQASSSRLSNTLRCKEAAQHPFSR